MPVSLKRSCTLAFTLVAASATAFAVIPAGSAAAGQPHNDFHQTNLISNLSTVGAKIVDPNMQNGWGLAFSPTSPLWVADNNAGVATVYRISPGGLTAATVPLTVPVPGGRKATGDGPSPTGQVFNGGTGFVVTSKSGSGPAAFIFDSEAGQISAWNPVADPTVSGWSNATIEYSSKTAVYKGLAIASTRSGTFLYATNFHDGTVDVFNSHFRKLRLPFSGFRDRFLPRGYAPFGIAEIHGLLYVSYAMQNARKHDDVAGRGHGFIDIYTNTGFLVRRLASRGALNSPWGMTVAPSGFGPFGGKLLVGNFGDGLIHGYGLFSGFLSGSPDGTLRNQQHRPVQIDGLWALTFGTATTGGTGTLLFSSGPNGEKDGLVGSINPAK